MKRIWNRERVIFGSAVGVLLLLIFFRLFPEVAFSERITVADIIVVTLFFFGFVFSAHFLVSIVSYDDEKFRSWNLLGKKTVLFSSLTRILGKWSRTGKGGGERKWYAVVNESGAEREIRLHIPDDSDDPAVSDFFSAIRRANPNVEIQIEFPH